MSVLSFGPHIKLNKSVVAPKTECGICLSEIVENETGKRNRNGESFVNTYSCNSCGQLFHSACANQWWLQYGQPSGNLGEYRINNRSAHDCPLCKMPWPPTDFNAAAPALNPVAPPPPPAPPLIHVNQLLREAARIGDFNYVVRLLDEGANVNDASDGDGDTALGLASRNDNLAVVTHLISAGANVNAVNNHDETALIIASIENHNAVVVQLLAAGANVNLSNTRGQTALMFASRDGHNAVVSQLIAAGANVNLSNARGQTALILASEKGHNAVVVQLLAAGANVNL